MILIEGQLNKSMYAQDKGVEQMMNQIYSPKRLRSKAEE